MPRRTVTLQLPFLGGLDQKTSPHYLDPTARLALVQDGNFTKQGVVDKRLGMGLLANLPNLASGRLTSWSKADLCSLSGHGVDTIETATALAQNLGPLPPAKVIRRPIVTTPSQIPPVLGDIAYNGTVLRVAVYQGPPSSGNSTLYATVWDAKTQLVVLAPTLIYTGTSAVVIPYGVIFLQNTMAAQQLAIFFVDGTTVAANYVQMYACNYVPSTNSFSAVVPVPAAGGSAWAAGVSLGWTIDVAPLLNDQTGKYLILAAVTTTSYSLYVMNPNHTINTTIVTAMTGPGGAYVSAGLNNPSNQCYVYGTAGEKIWALATFSKGTPLVQLELQAFDGNSFAAVGGTQNVVGPIAKLYIVPPVRVSATNVWLGWLIPAAGDGSVTNQIKSYIGVSRVYNSAVIVNQGTIPVGFYPAARPFAVNGVPYMPTFFDLYMNSSFDYSGAVQTLQGTLFLSQANAASGGPMFPVATSAPRQVDAASVYASQALTDHIPFSSAVAGTEFHVALKTLPSDVFGNPSSAVTQPATSTWETGFFFGDTTLYQPVELGSELHIAGGVPFICDGMSSFEDNFFYYPEFAYMAVSGVGMTGAYTYAVVYVNQDAAGNLHRSAPVFTNTITLANQGATVNFPPVTTWRDPSSAGTSEGATFAEIYRTTATPVTPIFYYLDKMGCSNAQGTTYLTYTDPGVTDAQLDTATVLYTTGGVLDQVCPPSSSCQCIHKGRVFATDDTLRVIWFTQQYSAGLAPGYQETLTIPMPDGGDITGLVSMDSELIVFKGTSIWIIYGGDGPNGLGQGSDLTTPQRVPSDVGAVDWRGICLTPAGIMFVAATGIYLLDRSLNVTFIGKNVVDLFASYPTCVSAVLVPGATQVRFSMINLTKPANQQAIVIVYDYLLGEWLEHTRPQQPNPISGSTVTAGTGRYAEITSDGIVWLEHLAADATAYCDDSTVPTATFVITSVGLAELKAAGVGSEMGYQCARWVQLRADTQSQCGLTIAISCNGDGNVVQSASLPYPQSAQSPPGMEMHVAGAYMKATSLSVTVSDYASGTLGNGQGARFIGVLAEIDVIGDRFRQVPIMARG
jgi:hypothetical protein